MKIFDWTIGTFFRTLGRILAYITVGVAIAYFSGFINIANVHAEALSPSILYNSNFGTYLDTNGFYYDESGTRLGLKQDYLQFVWQPDELGANYTYRLDFKYSQPTESVMLENGSFGISLSQCGMGFIENNYYLVSYYFFQSSKSTVHDAYSNAEYKIGIGRSSDAANANRNLNFYMHTTSGYTVDVSTTYYVTSFSVIFKANTAGTCVNLAYSSYSGISSSRLYFLGYKYENLGADVSSANIQAALDNQTAEITEQIDSMKEQQQQTNDKLDDLNNNITNSDTSEANKDANSFFENFENKDYGFSDIIKIPLQTINNITSAQCTPLRVPLPFVDTDFTLPCMYNIYQTYFGDVLYLYQTITFGVVAYWVCINLFRMVKNFKNPDNDEIEVFEL